MQKRKTNADDACTSLKNIIHNTKFTVLKPFGPTE